MFKRILITMSLLCVMAAAVAADDPIEQRQHLMHNNGKALKAMLGMVRGKRDFDAETVTKSLETIKQTAEQVGSLFPEGSETGHKTEAKSTIWTDREGFNKQLEALRTAAEDALAAKPGDVEALRTQLKNVMHTCKGCHDDYRVEKD